MGDLRPGRRQYLVERRLTRTAGSVPTAGEYDRAVPTIVIRTAATRSGGFPADPRSCGRGNARRRRRCGSRGWAGDRRHGRSDGGSARRRGGGRPRWRTRAAVAAGLAGVDGHVLIVNGPSLRDSCCSFGACEGRPCTRGGRRRDDKCAVASRPVRVHPAVWAGQRRPLPCARPVRYCGDPRASGGCRQRV